MYADYSPPPVSIHQRVYVTQIAHAPGVGGSLDGNKRREGQEYFDFLWYQNKVTEKERKDS